MTVNKPRVSDQGDPPVLAAARSLLGMHLVGHGVIARITEVEAYAGPLDPASHAFRRTPRSAIMYGPPDRLYVYRIHGHFCANVVTGPDGQASAVLLRGAEVIDGLRLARRRRTPGAADAALARGPGNLCRALGITMDDLGTDLTDGRPVCLRAAPPPSGRDAVRSGPRVGVRRNADVPWRFWITGDPTVSAHRRHPRAEA
ncbi:DNA-3-methyladenine glycosylase [Gordonia sp. DT30]|uniref:DNA-3-methyladenine glycosylase n=1 Tax=unclassified Gordonia (in: high G+C Gram-positive bacteria) TaxID=2657482 RepID=UPI003CF7D890